MGNLSGNARYNYDRMKNKLLKNYGFVHLCGHCQHMMECKRMEVQNTPYKNKKAKLMRKKAPFVTHFEIDDMVQVSWDKGFVTVYECDNFEYESF